ncbi:MAG: SPOR domain-containing protein, partial [Bacteroidota bacterium]|nr:SPOR domain-containing protein [Bacteroidota bacterium]
NELSDAAAMNANANRNKSKSILNDLDPAMADQVKAVVTADQSGNPSVARTGNPTGAQTTGTQTGAEPTGTQTTGTQTGTEPTGTQTTGTQTGTEPTGTQTTGTQTGTEPTGTQTTGTQPTTTATQTSGSNPSSVTNRLAPGEQLKLAAPSTTTTAPTIAVNPSLPEGLVYKVQIGAFRNPISAAIYNGISPVTAETTASGLTRYTAGLFKQFVNADAAKAEIRALGYKDAFVVAFYNGKRISIDEARRMTGEPVIAFTQTGTQPTTTGTQPATTGTQPTTTGTQPTTTGTQPATTGTEPVATSATSNPNAAKTTDVKELKGLFYTVQVGVYKNEVSKAKLKNLPDLVSERANGFIRYSSGKYCTAESAAGAKNNAVSKGIADAFVTAYYNGKRISVSEAKVLEATGVTPCQGGTTPTTVVSGQLSVGSGQSSVGSGQSSVGSGQLSVGSGQAPVVSEPVTTQPTTTTTTTQPATTTTQPQTTNNKQQITTSPPVPQTGLVFSVQIGAFRDEVPVEIANQFLQLASKGVKNYFDESTGLTVYQVGVCMNKEEADAFRSEAVAVGITDAFIVAFKDGKKITMEEAMELLGN